MGDLCSDDHSSGEPCPRHGYDDSVPAPAGQAYRKITRTDGEIYVDLVKVQI